MPKEKGFVGRPEITDNDQKQLPRISMRLSKEELLLIQDNLKSASDKKGARVSWSQYIKLILPTVTKDNLTPPLPLELRSNRYYTQTFYANTAEYELVSRLAEECNISKNEFLIQVALTKIKG